jgi:hypothetical protein
MRIRILIRYTSSKVSFTNLAVVGLFRHLLTNRLEVGIAGRSNWRRSAARVGGGIHHWRRDGLAGQLQGEPGFSAAGDGNGLIHETQHRMPGAQVIRARRDTVDAEITRLSGDSIVRMIEYEQIGL